MKRVRYLAGAAALAPVTAGLALPAASATATTSTPVKTVSLAHSGMESSTRVSIYCTANTAFNISQLFNVKAHGWYKNQSGGICIGTVDVSVKFNKTFSKSAFLSIYSQNGARLYPRKAHRIQGTAGTTVITTYTVHQLYHINYLNVCVASTYTAMHCQGIL
jgi:hypothetical protein